MRGRGVLIIFLALVLGGCFGVPKVRDPILQVREVIAPAVLPNIECPDFDLAEYNSEENLGKPLELRFSGAVLNHRACWEAYSAFVREWELAKARAAAQ